MKMLIFLALVFLSTNGCTALSDDCEDTIRTSAVSPDGKYIATVYERDCGATADLSIIVNLRDASTKFNGREGRVFIVKGQPQVDIGWNDKTSLKIACSSTNIFKQEKSWQDISISY
jgi:hypothetical protein